MTAQRFDLILTGELAPGHPRDIALQQLANLFKRPIDQVEKLLAGKPNRIRKDLDANEIKRYQQVFAKIGLIAVAKPCNTEGQAKPPIPAATPDSSLSLSPEGTPVLRDNERPASTASAPDTSHLSLAQSGEILSDQHETPPLPQPDTEHLSLGATGDDLLPPKPPELEIDLDALTADLSLSEAGTQILPDKPDVAHQVPDTSHLKLK
ncbi:hypothetical protein DOK_08709 [gamma proteobacterium BDW918]|uniref:Uncharacterized protein n=1 Tax=Zhongshania aliphaticivorans TaxID=1470434 RepID=A0A127M6E3_9GAMM|nr:hypothetical protein [Zhongshania aliphaticivorans]AMO68818.1 hypothetical protein AZF00_11140 [Zhongshania aliphaticivorans]EIF43550.1 hypothetical protein DOK_08709 [gamma proteobacterium BDW918]